MISSVILIPSWFFIPIIPKGYITHINSNLEELSSGIECITVEKGNLDVTLGTAVVYISNALETNDTGNDLIKPVESGIYIAKDCLCIVRGRFVISTKTANTRFGCGVRNYITSSDYTDSLDSLISVGSTLANAYNFIRVNKYSAGCFLRPIAMASSGGTCSACSLSVIALKATE